LSTGRTGRPRRYCAQACRQRAYEQRSAVQRAGLADDAVVLSGREFSELTDRIFQLRCAAEDVLSAVVEGAAATELHRLATHLTMAARALERLR
jgi:phage protein U